METYFVMTPRGSRGSNIEAPSLEDAEKQAKAMGYDVVDVTDYAGHTTLVILDD